VRLVSGVYLVVPVTYTCPSSLAGSIFTDQVQVTVIENTSKGLARGTGGVGFQHPSFNGIGFGTHVICDDSPHALTVNVFPSDPLGFKTGKAVATGFISIRTFAFQQFSAGSEPASIKVQG